jgi:hypothetical protein
LETGSWEQKEIYTQTQQKVYSAPPSPNTSELQSRILTTSMRLEEKLEYLLGDGEDFVEGSETREPKQGLWSQLLPLRFAPRARTADITA